MFTLCRPVVSVLTGTVAILATPLLAIANPQYPATFRAIGLPALVGVPASTIAFRYIPPKRGLPKRTQGSGSRGCPETLPVSLSLLVPQDHVGQTVSPHPTFFWYVSKPIPVPVEFALVESGVAQPLLVRQMEIQKAGMAQVAMPEDAPQLVTGRKYRWSVTLNCNSSRPSSDVFIQSWVERVSATPDLNQQLRNINSDRDRATVYARAGLWYDALAAISKAQTANPDDSSIHKNFLSLLDQVGLTEVAAPQQKNSQETSPLSN